MTQQLKIGDVVLSKKGHDAGSYYVVVAVVNNEYVTIADGNKRRISKPKLKKQKHLTANGAVLELIGEKLLLGKQVYDTELKKALKPFNEKEKNN